MHSNSPRCGDRFTGGITNGAHWYDVPGKEPLQKVQTILLYTCNCYYSFKNEEYYNTDLKTCTDNFEEKNY
jgi:hypothetical protein